MRTSKPPPRVRIQERRCSNVMLANGALCQGEYPHRVLCLLCRASCASSMEPGDSEQRLRSLTFPRHFRVSIFEFRVSLFAAWLGRLLEEEFWRHVEAGTQSSNLFLVQFSFAVQNLRYDGLAFRTHPPGLSAANGAARSRIAKRPPWPLVPARGTSWGTCLRRKS
jgi:hypothetical protein